MTPATISTLDAQLAPGKAFVSKQGIRIKNLSSDATSAKIRISGVDPKLVANDFVATSK